MEVVGRASAALQVVHCVVALERGSAAAGSSSHFRATAVATSSSSSSADCSPLRSRLGLAGSGLPRKRSSRRSLSFSSISSSSPTSSAKAGRRLPPNSASYSTPVSIWQEEENLFSTIDAHEMEVETPALLAQCSDMDWRRLVNELHSEALHSVESLGPKALCLKGLEVEMKSWIHDRMAQALELATQAGLPLEDDLGWSYESAAEELRMQANLQAAQHLARGVDASFDWEAETAELHRRVVRYGGAHSPEVMSPEQHLLHAWFQAQEEELDSSTRLVQEALASTAAIEALECQLLNGKLNCVEKEKEGPSKTHLEPVASGRGPSETDFKTLDKSWFGLGAVLAAGFGGVQRASAIDAIGANPAVSLQSNPESLEAASRAPSWLVPAILAFPVVSYFGFNLYRDKFNPNARVTDWMFSVVAIVIVANIVLMATIGVRLY